MAPYMQYVAEATMQDGTEPNFKLGENYEINCAFSLDGHTHISVVNSKGSVHYFDITEDWFSKSFVICGDLQSIWEEV
ncbi:MAG: hypothetical protein NZ811_05085 [Gammaproteobacteria bacterium]|nr:hypothetical protein [Gammaproteobacteria bacterium]